MNNQEPIGNTQNNTEDNRELPRPTGPNVLFYVDEAICRPFPLLRLFLCPLCLFPRLGLRERASPYWPSQACCSQSFLFLLVVPALSKHKTAPYLNICAQIGAAATKYYHNIRARYSTGRNVDSSSAVINSRKSNVNLSVAGIRSKISTHRVSKVLLETLIDSVIVSSPKSSSAS